MKIGGNSSGGKKSWQGDDGGRLGFKVYAAMKYSKTH